MNFRSLYDKKDFGLFWPQVLQILFFISYTVCRMMGMPYMLYLIYLNGQHSWILMSPLAKTGYVISTALFTCIFILCCWWYVLIIKGVMKLLGFSKKEVSNGGNEKLHNY